MRRRAALPAWALALGAAALGLPAIAADKASDKAPSGKAATARVAAADQAASGDDVDQDLLEFLGSVDTQTDDSSWFDFLRATDIGKLAKEKSAPAAPQEKKR